MQRPLLRLTRTLHRQSDDDALNDDLNVFGALGHLFDIIRETNRAMDAEQFAPGDAKALLCWWERINTTLALDPDATPVPEHTQALVSRRKAAREAKDWKLSDSLRAEIELSGWIVKDTKEGQKLTPASA